MSLQINLFEDEKIMKQLDRRFSFNFNRDFELSPNVNLENFLYDLVEQEFCDLDFMNSIGSLLKSPRKSNIVLGLPHDSHFPLEVLNSSKVSKGSLLTVSFIDLYKNVIATLTNSSVDEILSIPNIELFIDMISNLEFSLDFDINTLMGYCGGFDKYIIDNFDSAKSPLEACSNLVTDINSSVAIIIKYVASYFESYSSMSVVTFHKHYLVLTSKGIPNDKVLKVVYTDGNTLDLKAIFYSDKYSFYKTGGVL